MRRRAGRARFRLYAEFDSRLDRRRWIDAALPTPTPNGDEVQADWEELGSPESYLAPHSAARSPLSLEPELTSFVGRQRELGELGAC